MARTYGGRIKLDQRQSKIKGLLEVTVRKMTFRNLCLVQRKNITPSGASLPHACGQARVLCRSLPKPICKKDFNQRNGFA